MSAEFNITSCPLISNRALIVVDQGYELEGKKIIRVRLMSDGKNNFPGIPVLAVTEGVAEALVKMLVQAAYNPTETLVMVDSKQ